MKKIDKKVLARRLRKLGLTWDQITRVIYGHGGTQSYYTAKR